MVDLGDVEVHPEADGDQVGEEEDEPEEVEVPGPVEPLEAHHDDGEDHGGGEEDLGQVVELLVEQPDLGPRHGVVHRGAALAPGVDDDAEGGAGGDDGVGPQRVLDVERLLDVGVRVIPVVQVDSLINSSHTFNESGMV